MYPVWTPVKVKNEEHPRAGTAGIVFAINESVPDSCVVRFDADDTQESVLLADLQRLN